LLVDDVEVRDGLDEAAFRIDSDVNIVGVDVTDA
jgi:hypothetical protein